MRLINLNNENFTQDQNYLVKQYVTKFKTDTE